MPSSLPEPQKERGFPFTPSRKKKLYPLARNFREVLNDGAA